MVAQKLSDSAQLEATRKSICAEIKVRKSCPLAHSIGEMVKNALYGSKAYVLTFWYGLGCLLVTVSKKGEPKISYGENGEVCNMSHHTIQETHGFGSEIIENTVGRKPTVIDVVFYKISFLPIPAKVIQNGSAREDERLAS